MAHHGLGGEGQRELVLRAGLGVREARGALLLGARLPQGRPRRRGRVVHAPERWARWHRLREQHGLTDAAAEGAAGPRPSVAQRVDVVVVAHPLAFAVAAGEPADRVAEQRDGGILGAGVEEELALTCEEVVRPGDGMSQRCQRGVGVDRDNWHAVLGVVPARLQPVEGGADVGASGRGRLRGEDIRHPKHVDDKASDDAVDARLAFLAREVRLQDGLHHARPPPVTVAVLTREAQVHLVAVLPRDNPAPVELPAGRPLHHRADVPRVAAANGDVRRHEVVLGPADALAVPPRAHPRRPGVGWRQVPLRQRVEPEHPAHAREVDLLVTRPSVIDEAHDPAAAVHARVQHRPLRRVPKPPLVKPLDAGRQLAILTGQRRPLAHRVFEDLVHDHPQELVAVIQAIDGHPVEADEAKRRA